MRDCIFVVDDLTAFREALLASDSPLVHHDPEDGTARILPPTTMIHYSGNQSVAIARLDAAQLTEIGKFTNLIKVGEAKDQRITCNDDVLWIDEEAYYAVYDATPVTSIDEDGNESTFDKPKPHCVLA